VNTSRWNRRSVSAASLAVALLAGSTQAALAAGIQDQWFIGIGGTGAWLQPDPDQPGNNTEEPIGVGGTLMIGRDLDQNSSIQVQGFSLGEATIDSGDTVAYTAADLSVLYRFYDTRDNNLTSGGFGTSIFGRFGLGYMMRESDTELERGSEVYFGVGGGFETYFTSNLALRTEVFLHDLDAISGSLSLVFRVGGSQRGRGRLPTTLSAPTTAPTAPSEAPRAPQTAPQVATDPVAAPAPTPLPQSANFPDADKDGVEDGNDLCANSTPGYPVRADGCPLFDGVLSGIRFDSGSTELASGSEVQLDFLVDLLVNQYPSARIELHSHTDNEGSVRSQAILTRGRLKTVGTYLVERGVRANRLVLRSFGGSRPLYDNASSQGREANNRIEVLERPR